MTIDPPSLLRQQFAQQAQQVLQQLQEGLQGVSQDANSRRLYGLMRLAHSLRGEARAAHLPRLSQTFEGLETLLGILEPTSPLWQQGIEVSLQQICNSLSQVIQDPQVLAEEDPALLQQLDGWVVDLCEQAHSTLSGPPTAVELGVDITAEIFSSDVALGLDRLQQVLSQASGSEQVVGELRAQLDVFVGVGELTSLSGFKTIAEVALTALKYHPQSALQIGNQALQDLRAGHRAVLAGDRQQGGELSAELRAWTLEPMATATPQPELGITDADLMELEELLKADLEPETEGDLPEIWVTPQGSEDNGSDLSGDWQGLELPGERLDLELFSVADLEDLDSVFGGALSEDIPAAAEPGLVETWQGDAETYQLFVQEAVELLPVMEQCLLELARDPQSPEKHRLMRAAHSIKGGAALVGLEGIKAIAHQFETVVQKLGQLSEIDGELEGLLLQAYDYLRYPLMEQINTGQYDPQAAQAAFDLIYAQLQLRLGDLSETEVDLPISGDLEGTILQSIFSGEISAVISKWQQMLRDPEGDPIPFLQQQSEVIQGIGELVDLTGLTTLSQVMLQAIARYPEQARMIGQLALADLQQAQSLVLSGGRLDSIGPGEELLMLTGEELDLDSLDQITVAQRVPDTAGLPSSPAAIELGTAPPVAPAQTIRVDQVRLDRINNEVGELVTLENTLLLHTHQIESRIQTLPDRLERFERLSHHLRAALDQIAVAPHATTERTNLSEGFDSLQMDSYSSIHTIAQALLDEVGQVVETMQDLRFINQQSKHSLRKHRQSLQAVRDHLIWARMLPIGTLLQGLPRMVRDLSTQLQKQIDLQVIGGETLLDKAILERLRDPLIHLVRNAIDHGIESPSIRQERSKSVRGTIKIYAYYRGDQTIIEISDDGGGIDPNRVLQKAIALGLISPVQASALAPQQSYDLLFSPGFSTADQVSDISGRGVGLDLVKQEVESVKGTIEIDSSLGQGTTFTLQFPLTLTIAKLLIFRVGTHLFAAPLDTLSTIAVPTPDNTVELKGNRFFHWQDQFLPITRLDLLLPYTYPRKMISPDPLPKMVLPSQTEAPVVIVEGSSSWTALQIDHVIGEQELVIKPFGSSIPAPSYLYGCTILSDGQPVPILDIKRLVDQKLAGENRLSSSDLAQLMAQRSASDSPASLTLSVLIIDDSPAMRQTLTSTLSKAGYQVIKARTGQEGLDQLHQHPQVSAIICDIEMPEMNGFEFLAAQQQSHGHIPVIMLTTRGGEKHQQLAKHLGARDYLSKPYVEADLLQRLQICLRP